MPLLRKKPFLKESPACHLKDTDEVFFCELTGEVFTDYEKFYQRVILCNSLVWSCELSFKTNLTFKEAKESEDVIKKSISTFPKSLKKAALLFTHNRKHSKIQNLNDDVFDYLKTSFHVSEEVEVKENAAWQTGVITNVQRKDESLSTPLKTEDPVEYSVRLSSENAQGNVVTALGNMLRRKKGVFTKEKLKIVLKVSCLRTTGDDGYWVVKPSEVRKYSLGVSTVEPTIPKSKKKTSIGLSGKSSSKKKQTTLTGKNIDLDQNMQLDIERNKIVKMKEKEDEKARKKDEKEKEKETMIELKKLEADFLKSFSQPKEDLKLEDSQPLPSFSPFVCKLDEHLVADVVMVVEFVNVFGILFDLSHEIDEIVNFEWIEEALLEHNAEGKYFRVLKFLLHTYMQVEQQELQVGTNEDEDYEYNEHPSTNDEDRADEIPKKPSLNAHAAAVWPVLHQGMALHEIPIEPFSLTEVLRLHILSSGVKIGGSMSWNMWQHRGQYQFSDNPCVSFRHNEVTLMLQLVTKSVYDFPVKDKLKLLVLLCNQLLMLASTRDYMEDAFDKLKELRKQLREIQHAEAKRKRKLQQERWQKVVAERLKRKEEIKQRKEKLSKSKTKNESAQESSTSNVDEMENCARQSLKEARIEEFQKEKFLTSKREIMTEMKKFGSIIAMKCFGRDRYCRRYWNFKHSHLLLVETDFKNLQEVERLDYVKDEGTECNKLLPNPVSLKELLKTNAEGKTKEELIFTYYNIPYTNKTLELYEKSDFLKKLFASLVDGHSIDITPVKGEKLWYSISTKEQFLSLLTALNSRGLRENMLKEELLTLEREIIEDFDEKESCGEQRRPRRDKGISQKKLVNRELDQTIFKVIDDFIEMNLRDQLYDFEERLWIAGLGGLIESRDEWRHQMEHEMNRLNTSINEDKTVEPMDVDDAKVLFPTQILENETSRCSTPVTVPEGDKQDVVQELAQSLLQIMQSIEMKYLKPPLGESEEIRRERIKERMEAVSEKVVEQDKKVLTCLSRWQESLAKCTNFSQVFIHLNTLDRSVLWDKSVQNVKCRLCRRKGDEEQMLLCDGCDRGFHMSCLKPPLKKVPEGNWFCSDCRPVEIHNRNRRISSSKIEEVSEEEESEEEESESEEEVDISEESQESDVSDHEEFCTVCNNPGTLILCEECPRGFHLNCVYPPIRKVPSGKWTCQICRSADIDLPFKKRALIVEKTREKFKKIENGIRSSKRNHSSPVLTRVGKRAKTDDEDGSQSPVNTSVRSSTGISRQQLKLCSNLLNDVFKKVEAESFLFPVDLSEVPDYTDFIDYPMDFSTMKGKLNSGRYQSIHQFVEDVHLIFTNCEVYNPPQSCIVRNCAKLKTFVNRQFKLLKFI